MVQCIFGLTPERAIRISLSIGAGRESSSVAFASSEQSAGWLQRQLGGLLLPLKM